MTRFCFLIIDSNDRRRMVVHSVRSAVGQEKNLCISVPNNDDINDDDINDNATWIAIVHKNDLFNSTYKNNSKTIKLGDSITPGIQTLLQKAELVIGYTGGAGGLIHRDFINEAESAGFTNLDHWYCINQEVHSETYNQEGIDEIIKWTIGQHRSHKDLPRLLRIPESEGFETSLPFLCQGFLANHALKLGNRLHGAFGTKEFSDVAAALKVMGWVNENGSNLEIVKELERERSAGSADDGESGSGECNHDPSCNPESDLDFWQLPFAGGISLRQGLEREFRSLRKNVQDKIQKGKLLWPDNATLPCRTAKLVEAIEKAIKAKETLAEAINNNKLFDDDFICVVARAYFELNILLKAA